MEKQIIVARERAGQYKVYTSVGFHRAGMVVSTIHQTSHMGATRWEVRYITKSIDYPSGKLLHAYFWTLKESKKFMEWKSKEANLMTFDGKEIVNPQPVNETPQKPVKGHWNTSKKTRTSKEQAYREAFKWQRILSVCLARGHKTDDVIQKSLSFSVQIWNDAGMSLWWRDVYKEYSEDECVQLVPINMPKG